MRCLATVIYGCDVWCVRRAYSLVSLLLSSHCAKIRQWLRAAAMCSTVLLLLCPYMPIRAAKVHTETLYLNSDDSQSKHPACIISVASDQIPGRPFSLPSPLNYISLSPSRLNGKTECVKKLHVLGINLKKQQTATMRHRQQRRYLRNIAKGKQHSVQIIFWYILQAGGVFYILWLHSCHSSSSIRAQKKKIHWLVWHETG